MLFNSDGIPLQLNHMNSAPIITSLNDLHPTNLQKSLTMPATASQLRLERFWCTYGQGQQFWDSSQSPTELPPGWIFSTTERRELREGLLADINDMVCILA